MSSLSVEHSYKEDGSCTICGGLARAYGSKLEGCALLTEKAKQHDGHEIRAEVPIFFEYKVISDGTVFYREEIERSQRDIRGTLTLYCYTCQERIGPRKFFSLEDLNIVNWT